MAAAMVAPATPALSSSQGLIAMLEEDERDIKAHALVKINEVVG